MFHRCRRRCERTCWYPCCRESSDRVEQEGVLRSHLRGEPGCGVRLARIDERPRRLSLLPPQLPRRLDVDAGILAVAEDDAEDAFRGRLADDPVTDVASDLVGVAVERVAVAAAAGRDADEALAVVDEDVAGGR